MQDVTWISAAISMAAAVPGDFKYLKVVGEVAFMVSHGLTISAALLPVSTVLGMGSQGFVA